MKFFWFGIVLLAFCAICEVISDYTDSMLPLKDIRNRVHRTMRMNMRVGKRFGDSEYDEEDFKRCLPQFLQNPRVGKNDKTWKFNSAGTLHKRSDPKATDMWFGPRIGRSNEEPYEDLPWAYVLVNGNRPINGAVFKSNEVEDQPRDDLPE
uniref:Pheromone biosynthesis activating neuropeptide n=1 Tax=Dendroctonus ponderosae TaxID=77166 RepID=A0AAR5PQW1_DENPD